MENPISTEGRKSLIRRVGAALKDRGMSRVGVLVKYFNNIAMFQTKTTIQSTICHIITAEASKQKNTRNAETVEQKKIVFGNGQEISRDNKPETDDLMDEPLGYLGYFYDNAC